MIKPLWRNRCPFVFAFGDLRKEGKTVNYTYKKVTKREH